MQVKRGRLKKNSSTKTKIQEKGTRVKAQEKSQ
jgi:hypothetical protein